MEQKSAFKHEFGRTVRKYREQKGWTQMQLAVAVYADEEKLSRVSDVERGRWDPQAATVAEYRDALGISATEIEGLRRASHDPGLFEAYEKMTITHISLSVVARLHERMIELAHEWESLQDLAQDQGEAGEIEDAQRTFMSAMRKLGGIVDLYKSHRHAFETSDQAVIDEFLEKADPASEGEDQMLYLIHAVQKIHEATDEKLERLRNDAAH